jgi:selenium-binding protein 1
VERLQFGHRLHFFDARTRRHIQEVDLGDEPQMALELRPAHDPMKLYGCVGVATNLHNLASSIWVWYREGGEFRVKKVIEIPAQPADAAQLPPILQGFGAVPPLMTDINLSLDDRFLYASCWGTGELRQYDVSDPFHPKLTATVQMGGISCDDQFYPDGIPSCMVKLHAGADGGLAIDPGFYVSFGGARAHQVRLQGGDSSTDSFCFA